MHKHTKYILFFVYLKPSLDILSIELLNDSLVSISDKFKNHQIIVFGDFNANIGQLNQMSEEIFVSPNVHETRQSLHNITNTRGNKLVEGMEHLGFYTLNWKIQGGIPGKFTFINHNGNSTIDMAWLN